MISLYGNGEMIDCIALYDIHTSSSTITLNEEAKTCGGQPPDTYRFDMGLVLLPFTALSATPLGSHSSNRYPEYRVIMCTSINVESSKLFWQTQTLPSSAIRAQSCE
jgi:hypothetical protein